MLVMKRRRLPKSYGRSVVPQLEPRWRDVTLYVAAAIMMSLGAFTIGCSQSPSSTLDSTANESSDETADTNTAAESGKAADTETTKAKTDDTGSVVPEVGADENVARGGSPQSNLGSHTKVASKSADGDYQAIADTGSTKHQPTSSDDQPEDSNEKKSLLSPRENVDELDAGTDAIVREPEPPSPEDVARKAFGPPPGAKMLLKNSGLWADRDLQRVYVDGYIATNRGPLEMLACQAGTKEHESIIAALPKSSEVHASLLAINATPGTPVRFRPEFLPPTGQVIRIFVMWLDEDQKFHVADARQWVKNVETEKPMAAEFVFAGSSYWQDPVDGQEFYRADSGDMICVSNFPSAMIDVSMASSDDADSLLFMPFTDKIPERYTPVRMVLIPVPQPTDAPRDVKAEEKLLAPPTADYLPASAESLPATAESVPAGKPQ